MSALAGYSTPRVADSNMGGTEGRSVAQQTPIPLASPVQSAIGNKQPPVERPKPEELATCPAETD